MTSSRALLSALALLAALAAVGTAFATPADQESAVSRSGGTLAKPVEPVVELRGGGSVAPPTAESGQTADAGEETEAPLAQAGQAEPPTTPGDGEPSGEEPSGEQAPAAESSQTLVEDPATEELAGPVADTGGGGLPSTGLELGAMAIVGLGLLLLGAALRPRRDGPAHRR
jgi:hypothetical protein